MTLEEVTEQTSFRYLPWTHNTGRIYQISGDANAYANILETRLTQADEEKARLLDELNRVKVEGAQIEQDMISQRLAAEGSAKEIIAGLQADIAAANATRDQLVARAKKDFEAELSIVRTECAQSIDNARTECARLVDAARAEMRRAGTKRAAELVAAVQAAVDRLYKDGN